MRGGCCRRPAAHLHRANEYIGVLLKALYYVSLAECGPGTRTR
jgi:hypothetical protein